MAEIIWDSELGPSWPSDWPDTTIHAQFVAVTGDGADTDRLPDIAPSGNGEVVFTPSLRTVRYVGADGPYVVSLKQYRAVVDSEGYLCTPDQYGQPGERGIVLPSTDAPVIEPRGEDDNAFTWRVAFDIPAVTIRSDHIAVPVDGPYNLVDLLSPERAAGVVHIIDRVSARDAIQAAQEATAARDLVLPARDETLAARDEVLAHGAPIIDTSVGTRVLVGDIMIHGETGWREIVLTNPDVSGSLYVKRDGNYVDLFFYNVTFNITDTRLAVINVPSGFRSSFRFNPYEQALVFTTPLTDTPKIYRVSTFGNELRLYNPVQGDTVTGHTTYLTSDPWPSSLPGTPD